jgi:hypothetical protein
MKGAEMRPKLNAVFDAVFSGDAAALDHRFFEM